MSHTVMQDLFAGAAIIWCQHWQKFPDPDPKPWNKGTLFFFGGNKYVICTLLNNPNIYVYIQTIYYPSFVWGL